MISLRKWLILTHRYLGLVLSLLFVVWFLSGIAMIYAGGMPELTPATRLERLPAIDFSAVRITPLEAARRAQLANPPDEAVLLTIMGRPAYRFTSRGAVIVFADTGEVFMEMNPADAVKIASQFLRISEEKVHDLGVLTEADQWTITERHRLPMHKLVVDDTARTQLYVSEESAEVALQTTRGSRALAWVSAIPHWLYFSTLRLNDSAWRQVVLWTSGVGSALALFGIVLGLIQFSPSRPHIPYAGWMRWHHVLGLFFGIVTLTWVFSGMLSMEPWFWASVGGSGDGIPDALAGGPLDLSVFPSTKASDWTRILPGHSAKEVEFVRIQGEPYYVIRGTEPHPLLAAADPLQVRREPFSMESLMSRAKEGNPGVRVVDTQLLSDYDSYYYPRGGKPPLPVLRVKFGDPDRTWFYIDPAMSRPLARYTRRERLQRWIYHGLHSLDFSFWYYNRPVWDAGMIVLNAGGALLSGLGLVLGIKRLGRNISRELRQLRQ